MSAVFLLSACDKELTTQSEQTVYKLSMNRTLDLSNESLSHVDVLLFDANNQSKEVLNNINVEGLYYPITFNKNEVSDILVFANNDRLGIDFSTLADKSFNEIAQLQTTPIDFSSTYPSLFYTGRVGTSAITSTNVDIALTRSVSRIDVRVIADMDITIDSCIVSNLIDRTALLSSSALTPTASQLKEARFKEETFANMPTKLKEGLVYIYESNGVKPLVTFYTKIQGINTKLTAELPMTIERNKKYEIAINGRGATLYTSLSILEWEEGETTEATPETFSPVIDLANSSLPSFVRVSEKQDTLYIPSCHTSFEIAIEAGVETEIRVEDPALKVIPLSRNTYYGSRFRIEVEQLAMNSPKTLSRIYVKDKAAHQYYGHHITVVREASRINVENEVATIKADSLIFNGYKDGLIGELISTNVLTTINSESVDTQFNWIKIDDQSNGIYSIHGTFKPNDTEAVGQQQISKVSFVFADGAEEVYYFSRKRTSLPVVKMAGRYWGKYNMRGNSKVLNDQIGFEDDIHDLWSYLQNCTDEQFVYYAGAAYKGRSTTGLYFAENTFGSVSYEAYNTISNADIYNAANDIHCPDGYLMPSKDEYGLILPTNMTLTLPAEDGSTSIEYTAASGGEFSLRRMLRAPIAMGEAITGNLYVIEITEQTSGHKIYFIDAGHQFGNANASSAQTAWGYQILACTNSVNQYCVFQNNQNKFQMQPHNSAKTRVVRAIKSAVEYIIE